MSKDALFSRGDKNTNFGNRPQKSPAVIGLVMGINNWGIKNGT